MTVDKNQAIIEYLINCPAIADNPLFFNVASVDDNNNQIVTYADDKALDIRYVDGSVMKQFTFGIVTYKSVVYNQIVKIAGYEDENVADMLDVKAIIDWISEQNDKHVYPNFGSDCVIDSIEALYNEPNLMGVNDDAMPNLAQYETLIRVYYLDTSKRIWK